MAVVDELVTVLSTVLGDFHILITLLIEGAYHMGLPEREFLFS